MKLLRHPTTSASQTSGCIATIGNFDGLHLAHQKIFGHMREKSLELNLPTTVISFEPLPGEYFSNPPVPRIYPLRDKVRYLNELGIERYVCQRFNANFAQQEAEEFVRRVLLDALNVRYLVVGDDFQFGRGRKGNYELLKAMGEQYGMQVSDTPTLLQDGQRVSSTLVRKLLGDSQLEKASSLLGRAYQLSGRIRHGDKRGRTIGFPTLNLRMPDNLALQFGVYAVKVRGLGGEVLSGVANLGKRPTVCGIENRLEVHLFDFDEQVYGRYISVEPVSFIRPEQKFESFDILKTQILADAEQARDLLAKI